MNCREFSDHVCYCLPTFEAYLLPAEAQSHLDICSKCRSQLAELRAGYKRQRRREKKLARKARKAVAGILAEVRCRIKRDGPPPEFSD